MRTKKKKEEQNNSRRESKQMSELKAPEHLTRSKWKPSTLVGITSGEDSPGTTKCGGKRLTGSLG